MKKNKALILGLVVVLLVVAVFGWQYFPPKKENVAAETVSVGYVNSTIDYELLSDIATDKGFAQDNSIVINKMPVSKDSTDLLLTGNADYILNATTNILSYYINEKEGKEIKWISANIDYPSNSYLISKYSKEDLNKITRVGVRRIGGADQVLMAAVLKKINPINTPEYVATNDDMAKLTLLRQDELDAVVVASVKSRNEIAKDGVYYTSDLKDVLQDIKLPGGIITLNSTLTSRPVATKNLVKTIYQSSQYIKNNRSETIEYIISHYGLNTEEATDTYEGLTRVLADNYVPDTSNLSTAIQLVKDVFEITGERDLGQLTFIDYAKDAQGR